MRHDYDNVPVIRAALKDIRDEMDRLYWNKYQKQMESPFDNTGENYSNSVFTVRAYYWGDNDNISMLPNFEYKGLKVFWYKHAGRGLEILVDKPLTISFVSEMITECYAALKNDFEGGESNG